MDVGDWLRNLGLGQYEVAFGENAIDAEVLPDLNDSDLAQLAIPLGHRKRLLKAIAAQTRRERAWTAVLRDDQLSELVHLLRILVSQDAPSGG